MPGKSVPLSVRISDRDAVFLANLKIGNAVTPSEKLRAILREAQRRDEGLRDAGDGGLLLRDMSTPARRGVRRLEAETGLKSDVIVKLYERIPDIMARLIAGPEKKTPSSDLESFEKELLDNIGLLLRDFITLGLTSPPRVYNEENYNTEMKPAFELVEMARGAKESKRKQRRL